MPVIAQKAGNWCWVACLEMVRAYFKAEQWPQCEIVRKFFAREYGQDIDCCHQTPVGNLCDVALEPSRMFLAHDVAEVVSQTTGDAVDDYRVRDELRANHPVQVELRGESQGHVVLLTGFGTESGKAMVRINDPLNKLKQCRFEDLKNGIHGEWVNSWVILGIRI